MIYRRIEKIFLKFYYSILNKPPYYFKIAYGGIIKAILTILILVIVP